MSIGERAYKVLEEMSYERLGGTKEELSALEIIKREVDALGVENTIEDFEVNSFEIESAEFVVTKPKREVYNVNAFGMCSSTNPEGVFTEFYYLENTKQISLLDLKGKTILLTSPLSYQVYEDLAKKEVAAIVVASGSIYDDLANTDLEEKSLRERHYKHGKIPCFTMRMTDCEKLVLSNPEEVYFKVIQKESLATSHNLVATIKGSEKPEEVVCFTAHYDSVRFSTGAYDNGTGSVTILEVLHYYVKNAPKRTLKFIWCGSEEMGLLGSHAYVNSHKEELENYKLCINVDMTGVPLGKDIAVCTSEMSLVNYIDYYAKNIGFMIDTNQGVYSSDSTPFAFNNVPAVSFARISPRGGAEIHSRRDVISLINPIYLEKTILFIISLSENLISSVYFPVPKSMPQNMKDELDKYLGNKKNA
jgi:hypothetical protein